MRKRRIAVPAGNKGVVIIVAMMVTAVLVVLTGAYFVSMMTEKRSSDAEKTALQAFSLAESGAAHARAELRQRVRTDLRARVALVTNPATFRAYVNASDSLGFLRDYVYAAGDPQFSVAAGTAVLNLTTLTALVNSTAVNGNYSAQILVQADGAPSSLSADVFRFPFKYSINSTGQAAGLTGIRRMVRLDNGMFNVTLSKDTFSKYALFTFHHRSESGGVVWFINNMNFSGPVHTNERFAFANNPSAHFTEEVSQFNTTARFYDTGGNGILLNASSNPPRDVPQFDKNFTRGSLYITLNSSVTQADVKAQALGTLSEPGTNGIYIPNNAGAVTGGIFIRGNCNITTGVGAGNSAVYNISQGSAYKRVTVDYAANSTSVNTNGSNITNYTGIPDGVGDQGVIIYARDNITRFNGTVQRSSAVTISSERDLVISNNVVYEQYSSSPYNATGYSNILSMLSWNGDVRIGTSCPNNVTVHGVVMAPNGVFKVDDHDSGAPRGTATLFGGVITDYYGAFCQFSGTTVTHGYLRNFIYDARMLGGMSPPYFPYTNTFTSTIGQDANGTEDLNRPMTWRDQGG